ncbi:Protein ROOT PRIMORDIUM DEFTIVE 1 [Stylosanthes scabra]|uniref:Protein ROOT PRIMORDIUM DEFTIVE 1 n=1 Tax=Stylosanthes scabra TaxID=79078 RepID=A0ABU6W4U7_9FABA|nr:Protein ROOT PRIMORDIUM DEFTIVE 1 [Stylosanthes scabra]
MSQSTSIPKKMQRVRDHGYDNYMEVEKKTRKVLKVQNIILNEQKQSLPISRLETLAHRIGFTRNTVGAFILKFPHVFEIFEHPVQRILFCRLTRQAILQIKQEREALLAQVPRAVTCLRKLLMISNTQRLRLEHVRIARSALGLPDDFEFTVVLRYPQFFRLVDSNERRNKYIELVEREPSLAVCAIESVRERIYRERGGDAEDVRFSFLINFPPGFKIGKYFKIAMWKWQRLPYWSPYEDKKITLERIAHFRQAMNLPNKLKDFLLQHQGIFYISTRGNQGKLHTVFLREAYRKGELIEPNDLYLARRKLAELVLLSPRKARVDRELVGYRRSRLDDEMGQITRAAVEDPCEDFKGGDRMEQDKDEEGNLTSDIGSDVDSDVGDEDSFDDDSVSIQRTS